MIRQPTANGCITFHQPSTGIRNANRTIRKWNKSRQTVLLLRSIRLSIQIVCQLTWWTSRIQWYLCVWKVRVPRKKKERRKTEYKKGYLPLASQWLGIVFPLRSKEKITRLSWMPFCATTLEKALFFSVVCTILWLILWHFANALENMMIISLPLSLCIAFKINFNEAEQASPKSYFLERHWKFVNAKCARGQPHIDH